MASSAPGSPRAARVRARPGFAIRPAAGADLDQVIEIDAQATGLAKPEYWRGIFQRYAGRARGQRWLLVAEGEEGLLGFVVGEVRDWEFGSPPCGWVFGINVRPSARQGGVGTRLLDAICDGFRRAGVREVRTLLARDNGLVMSFFRSQGMMAAPFIALERAL